MSDDAIPGFHTPYSTSEFRDAIEAYRSHHHRCHDQTVAVAAELKSGLIKVGGHLILLRVDGRLAAHRVVRHFAQAAAYDLAAGKAALRAWSTYLDLFTKNGASGGRKFKVKD